MDWRSYKPEDILKIALKNYGLILCALIFLLLAINLLNWLSIDRLPIGWDQEVHFDDSIKVYRILTGGLSGLPNLIKVDDYYPPLIALMTTPFYVLFNISPDVAVAGLNMTSLAILVFSVYSIGNKIKGPAAGVISAFIISIYPGISILSTVYMIDLPLTAMVSLSMYALLLTDYFKDKKYSVLFGVTLGLGLLTKWTFVIFMAGPLLYVLYRSFQQARLEKYMDNIKSISMSFIAGAIVSSVWYLPNLYIFLELFKHGSIDTWAPQYTTILIYSLSLVFILLAIGMLIYLIITEKLNSYNILFIAWIVIPLIIFSLQSNRDYRFIAPIFPAFALISGIGSASLKNKKIKLAIVSAIFIFGLLIFFTTFYAPYDHKISDSLTLCSYVDVGTTRVDFLSPLRVLPSPGDWKEDEIFNTIVNDSKSNMIRICVIPENPRINGPIGYLSTINNIDLRYNSGGYDPYAFFNYEYVVTLKDRKGYWGPEDTRHIFMKSNYAQDLLDQHMSDFTLVKRIAVPDGDVLIYRHSYNMTPDSSPEHMVGINFSDKIQFIGYDIKELDMNKSKEMDIFGREINVYEINYYWEPLQRIDENYTIFVHFTDDNGTIKFQQDRQPFDGKYQTSEWHEGKIIREKCVVRVPWYVQSGTYSIGIGFFIPDDHALLPDRSSDEHFTARALIGNVTFVNHIPDNYALWPDYLKL